jgi:hypothetical protein
MASYKFLYNTNLAKGTGLINETLTLLEFYLIGEKKQDFLERCIASNILNKSTEHRTKDIVVSVFFDRYWKSDDNAIKNLKQIRENGLSLQALKSLLLVYTARANPILFDFILEIRDSKLLSVNREIARTFILRAISDNKAPKWSDSIIIRVASYLISCLKDFDIIDKNGLIRYKITDQKVINFILHELHFMNYSDEKIINDDVWVLLGSEFNALIKEIERISFKGTFIFQYSGELLKIGWNFNNMEDFIAYEYR